MLKQIKYISIFVIVSFYMLQSTSLFSGSFIENIKDMRYKIQVSKLALTETKEIPISIWNKIEKKKEFKINGVYYDVVSYKENDGKIIAKVVKDTYEHSLKLIIDNLFKDKEHPLKGKKKNSKTFFQISSFSSSIEEYPLNISKNVIPPNYREIIGKTNKIIVARLRPPSQ